MSTSPNLYQNTSSQKGHGHRLCLALFIRIISGLWTVMAVCIGIVEIPCILALERSVNASQSSLGGYNRLYRYHTWQSIVLASHG